MGCVSLKGIITYHHVFPLGFHWYSVRAKLNTDWFLQTDAEGDTQSLINWPSRYSLVGCVSPVLTQLDLTRSTIPYRHCRSCSLLNTKPFPDNDFLFLWIFPLRQLKSSSSQAHISVALDHNIIWHAHLVVFSLKVPAHAICFFRHSGTLYCCVQSAALGSDTTVSNFVV